MGGIEADDPQAVQKLEKETGKPLKITGNHEAVNAYYRKKHQTLDGRPHFTAGGIGKTESRHGEQLAFEDKRFATLVVIQQISAEIWRGKTVSNLFPSKRNRFCNGLGNLTAARWKQTPSGTATAKSGL